MDLGDGIKLIYATMQPICCVSNGLDGNPVYYFAETPGVKPEFLLSIDGKIETKPVTSNGSKDNEMYASMVKTKSGKIIYLRSVNEKDSLKLVKATIDAELEKRVRSGSQKSVPTLLKPAGTAREIPLVPKSQIAAAPIDDDFTNAAVWQIKLPAKIDLTKNPLLRIGYVGDVARLTLNGKLIADNFYAGRPFDLGLKRYGQDIFTGDLRLEILPLRKDAPVYIEPKDRPDFGTNTTLLKLHSVEIVQQ
jgi:hypothetical protein